MMTTVAAIDLGAESGRVLTATLDGEGLELAERYRFSTPGYRDMGGRLRWDLTGIAGEVSAGLARAGTGERLRSAGADAWGIDFGLLDSAGNLLADPVSHRDERVHGVLDEAAQIVGRERLYTATGCQLLPCNSIYQLGALVRDDAPELSEADRLLMIPDLLHRALSGVVACEYTGATTTGCYDVRAGRWARSLLDELSIPHAFLRDVVAPGAELGPLRGDLREVSGLRGTQVVSPASHDTASAVVAVPFEDSHAGFISSGTWSLVGMEVEQPVVSTGTLAAQLTNEGGYGGRTRLLRNVTGLWLLQECRRVWAARGLAMTYAEIVRAAEAAEPWRSLIDTDAEEFLVPGDMPERIRAFCARTGQSVPRDPGEIARCAFESLALRYRATFEDLSGLSERPVSRVHIVGGGSRNAFLCQLTADVAGVDVLAGPVEAAAIGNALVQLIALGEIGSLEEARSVVRSSARITRYSPSGDRSGEEAYARFRSLAGHLAGSASADPKG